MGILHTKVLSLLLTLDMYLFMYLPSTVFSKYSRYSIISIMVLVVSWGTVELGEGVKTPAK